MLVEYNRNYLEGGTSRIEDEREGSPKFATNPRAASHF